MSLRIRKLIKNVSKTFAITLFALLMFTNIKLATMDESELIGDSFTILGIKVNLFQSTFAGGVEVGNATCIDYGCFSAGDPYCAIFLNQHDTYTYCYFLHDN